MAGIVGNNGEGLSWAGLIIANQLPHVHGNGDRGHRQQHRRARTELHAAELGERSRSVLRPPELGPQEEMAGTSSPATAGRAA